MGRTSSSHTPHARSASWTSGWVRRHSPCVASTCSTLSVVTDGCTRMATAPSAGWVPRPQAPAKVQWHSFTDGGADDIMYFKYLTYKTFNTLLMWLGPLN